MAAVTRGSTWIHCRSLFHTSSVIFSCNTPVSNTVFSRRSRSRRRSLWPVMGISSCPAASVVTWGCGAPMTWPWCTPTPLVTAASVHSTSPTIRGTAAIYQCCVASRVQVTPRTYAFFGRSISSQRLRHKMMVQGSFDSSLRLHVRWPFHSQVQKLHSPNTVKRTV